MFKIHGDKAYWQPLSEAEVKVKPCHIKNIFADKGTSGANSNSCNILFWNGKFGWSFRKQTNLLEN